MADSGLQAWVPCDREAQRLRVQPRLFLQPHVALLSSSHFPDTGAAAAEPARDPQFAPCRPGPRWPGALSQVAAPASSSVLRAPRSFLLASLWRWGLWTRTDLGGNWLCL